jgi:hypothetical protein
MKNSNSLLGRKRAGNTDGGHECERPGAMNFFARNDCCHPITMVVPI